MFFSHSTANDKSALNEYLVVLAACIISFSCGVHLGWTSPYIPKLMRSEDYPFEINNEAASYIAIFGPVGDIFGEVLSMLLVDRIGRKNSLVVLGSPILMSCVLLYLSYLSPLLIYVARFLGGISMGTLMTVMPMYISEIARPAIRGKLGVITVFAYTFGVIVVNLVGNYLNMFESSLIFAMVNVIFLFTFFQMPESPYYLLMKGKIDKAEESLVFLRRTKDVNKELLCLRDDVNRQQSESGRLIDLFTIESNRKALFLIVLGRIFQQLTGGSTFMMYGQNLLQDSKYMIEPHFAVIIISFVQAWMGLISGSLADRFGRVSPMVYSSALCSVILVLLAAYYIVRDFTYLMVPGWTVFLLFGLYYATFQIGIGTLVALVLGEIFSTSIKPKAICLANLTHSITIIIATKIYQVSTDYLHASVCFFFFAICCLMGAFFMKFYLPETKGKTLEEIQMELKGIVRRQSKISITC